MVAPEIDLPSSDDLRRTSNTNTVFNDDSEKDTPKDASISDSLTKSTSNNIVDENSPISYQYLTFETPLPVPVRNDSPSSLPPPPDLKKYTSPFDWPSSRKNFTIQLSCLATLVTAYNAGSYSPASSQMAAEWNVSSVAITAGITTFCTGFGIAPMVLAPFSEINGRYPVFVGAGILFLISQICCAVTRSFAGMLLARFFVGCGSSVFSTMVGGVVSDLYHKEGRNTPMALFSGAALFGTGLGPLASGFIAQNTDWRWVFWVQVITCGLLILAVTVFFKETRGSILLSRKAKVLNKYYETLESAGIYSLSSPSSESEKSMERIRWLVKSDEERESLPKMIGISIYRPFHLLTTEPVVFFFSLWVAFAWAALYLTFGSIPLVFGTAYGWTLEQSNAVFGAMMLAAGISTMMSIYQERFLSSFLLSHQDFFLVRKWGWDPKKPEARLYNTCLQTLLLPAGLFLFGFSALPSIHPAVPILSIVLATMGIYAIYLATFNYLADTYHRYASSALAAQSFCRNILGGVFPLVTVQMFTGLGYRGAGGLLAGIALLLSAVPWVLVAWGPRIRARSKFAAGGAVG